jgi:hypothetical protein
MQRTSFLFLLASAVALAIVGSPTSSSAAPPAELNALTVDQVAARIAAHDGKTFIYDNNSKESWVAGHLPGAKWLDDESVTAAALPTDMAATLIFYCHNET